jgi:predicted ATPase
MEKITDKNKKILYIIDRREDYTIVKNIKMQTLGYLKNGKTYDKAFKIICNGEAAALLYERDRIKSEIIKLQ